MNIDEELDVVQCTVGLNFGQRNFAGVDALDFRGLTDGFACLLAKGAIEGLHNGFSAGVCCDTVTVRFD